ncbi:hypothetical protein HY948_02570 [Candidatus Gottesmanbacteria bacterium]|nr:hypothetical protein [Candidatus Gottesmanbacteria bacterium]
MKRKCNEHAVGLTAGVLVGSMHLGWAVMVSAGYAQGLLDWMYNLHFLDNPFVVLEFQMSNAVILVAVTSVVGYAAGCGSAWVWNRLGAKQ